jgi:hypothetical protein
MFKTAFMISVLLVIGTIACRKGADVAEKPKEEQTKFPPPKWKADETGRYPASMTAVVVLPALLQTAITEEDQLAAFIGGECRGEGARVRVGSTDMYFVLIRGLADEQSPVTFKYYNAKSSFLYQTGPVVNFLIDGVYGTAESPKVLDLSPVK